MDFKESDFSGALNGKPISARTDGGKGDRFDLSLSGQLQTGPVTTGQQFILVVLAALPNRSHRMDNPLGRKPIALGYFGVARGTTA